MNEVAWAAHSRRTRRRRGRLPCREVRAHTTGRSASTRWSPPMRCASSSGSCLTGIPTHSPPWSGWAFPTKSLANSIRTGQLDGREAEVLPCLRAVVGHRLAVAHPGYDRSP